ncbi:GlxA family transcriptional regulator [Metapseudomonas furukawaii]
MKKIAIVLFHDVLLLDIAGPMEVFSIANRYLRPEHHYHIVTIGPESGTIRASKGLMMRAELTLARADETYDLLLVPGGPGAYHECHPDLVAWLPGACERSARYGSICTGAFILGHAGLLDGHRVTTHWNYTERLTKAFPRAQVETDHIFLEDRRLVTSGGVTAGIDLALSMVALDHGRKVALDVAKVLLVVMTRQGGQAQFSPLVASLTTQETAINRVQNHVVEHLDQSFSIAQMAEIASMSPRHFARLFAREVGMTPMEFLQNVRIDHARGLLESSDLPLKTIAFRSGFGSVRLMRQRFVERLGLTPLQYRRQFG